MNPLLAMLLISESGKLYTFGENENGKLGLSESQLSDTSRPQPVATKDGYFTAVACGAGHTIALTKDGKVFSFGDGSRGQLGQGTRAQELREPKVIQQLSHLKAKYVSCGDCHTAVITGGSFCSSSFRSSFAFVQVPGFPFRDFLSWKGLLFIF